jgi:signal transduction histidine kinase/ActR/RegA family two-component response regulator
MVRARRALFLAAGVIVTAVASGVALYLNMRLGSQRIFLVFFPAIFAATWLAGRLGGLLSIGLSLPGILYLMPPRGHFPRAFYDHSPGEWLSLGFFVITGTLIVQVVAQLQRANARLARTDRRKDEFLAILGHELRNPLAAIRSATHVLNHLCAEQASTAHCRGVIARQTAQLSRMVDDLLDLSRINHDRLGLRRERLDLGEVVDRAVETARHFIATRGHEIIASIPERPLWFDGDPARLEQVLCNLLFNAAKYTESDGRITVTAELTEGEIRLSVKDTGHGIPPELLPHVFDLFFQAPSTRLHSQAGLGIGLSLVRRLVEMHGGTVEAHSAGVGLGSEFVIVFPRAPLAALQPPAPSSARTLLRASEGARARAPLADPALALPGEHEPTQTSDRHVLVVDDDEDVASMLSSAIRMWGFTVNVAHDGHAAIRMALADPPDFLLLDIGLPDLDGYEVARQLRTQLPGASRTRFIALTGYGQPEDRRRAEQAGFHVHLTKPTDLDELRDLLDVAPMDRSTVRPPHRPPHVA